MSAIAEATVSIVVVETAPAWTAWCLERIRQHTGAWSDLIVADGATGSQLGFSALANDAAARARGDALLFLHSDTLVLPEWLTQLTATLASSADIGAAVPSVLHFDGSLQEAGTAITRSGAVARLGDGDDPGDPRWNFVREVPAGSCPCMLIRRSAFFGAGGFDPSLISPAPAAADLALSLTACGWRILCQPAAAVQHARTCQTGSLPDDRSASTFRQRWAARRAVSPLPADAAAHDSGASAPLTPRQALEARDGDALERILVVDDRVPHVDRGGGDPRMFRMLTELSRLWPRARVTLLAMSAQKADLYAPPLRAHGIEVVCDVDPTAWLATRRFFYGTVIVSRPQPDALLAALRESQPQARRVYDMEAIFFRRLQRMRPVVAPAAGANLDAEIEAMRARECRLVAGADAVLCVSEVDRGFVEAIAPETPAFVVPHPVTVAPSPGFYERRDVVFYGGFMGGSGTPNDDAVKYLVREVMPLVWRSEPAMRLLIVGADPTDQVLALEGDRVRVIGYAAQPADWLATVRVHVAPMRFGSGIKLKLLDTMAAGTPFVTTSIGAEGIPIDGVRSVVVGDSPDALAQRVLALYSNAALWARVRDALVASVRAHFTPEHFRRALVEAMSSVGIAPPPPRLRAIDGQGALTASTVTENAGVASDASAAADHYGERLEPKDRIEVETI